MRGNNNPKTDKIIGYSKAPKNPNKFPDPKSGANAIMRIADAKKKGFKVESVDLGKPEGFFSEEMDPTDHVRFNKETNMFCVYDKDGKKVYESEKEEEANQYAIDNHDALMGRDDLEEISAKLNKKGEIEMTKAKFAKVHKDYKTKIKGQPYAMQIDPKTGGSALFPVTFVKESVELDEAKSSSGYDLYHRDFSGAMQHAYAFAKKKGFIVDKDEIDSKVAMGPRRPSSGKTNKYILGTNKKKNVHVQVANLDILPVVSGERSAILPLSVADSFATDNLNPTSFTRCFSVTFI